MGQNRDKHARDDVHGEPCDGKSDRLARVETHEIVFVVRFDVEEDNPGNESEQIGQSRDWVALRLGGLFVHRTGPPSLLVAESSPILNQTLRNIAIRVIRSFTRWRIYGRNRKSIVNSTKGEAWRCH